MITRNPQIDGRYPVTADALIRHGKAYGLDNEHTGYKGSKKEYKGYKSLRGDSLIEVARAYLNVENFVYVLAELGYWKWAKQARAEYEEATAENEQIDV